MLNKMSEGDDVFSEVVYYMRLGKYEEGKRRDIKLKVEVSSDCKGTTY